MDIFDGHEVDEDSGQPFTPIEIVNAGVHKDLMDQDEVKSLNNFISLLQFEDLRQRWGNQFLFQIK